MKNQEAYIYVKNMVCPRCISAVGQVLRYLEIDFKEIALGEIALSKPLGNQKKELLEKQLEKQGFALMSDRKSQLIEKMKGLVINKIHHTETPLEITWADYISDELCMDYKYLGSLFSSVESITFEQYIIHQKIERVKEILIYDEVSLKEIAFQLDYSSVAYLSNQFKKITGMTPSQFKKLIVRNRKSLDEI